MENTISRQDLEIGIGRLITAIREAERMNDEGLRFEDLCDLTLLYIYGAQYFFSEKPGAIVNKQSLFSAINAANSVFPGIKPMSKEEFNHVCQTLTDRGLIGKMS